MKFRILKLEFRFAKIGFIRLDFDRFYFIVLLNNCTYICTNKNTKL